MFEPLIKLGGHGRLLPVKVTKSVRFLWRQQTTGRSEGGQWTWMELLFERTMNLTSISWLACYFLTGYSVVVQCRCVVSVLFLFCGLVKQMVSGGADRGL